MSSGAYAAASSSGEARSALVSSSSGSIRASNAATMIRSIMPTRGGGSASAVTITSWSALATIGRSYGSSSSAVRRSTVSRSSTSTTRASVPSSPETSPSQPDPVADDHAHPAELAGLGGVDLPALVGAGQHHP